MDAYKISRLRKQFENELYENVIPFWEKHSIDKKHGGFFNCLERDGRVYDTTKYVWMLGRQTWMFSKLYKDNPTQDKWREIAKHGVDFLTKHTKTPEGRNYFAVRQDGAPIQFQRKIFSECFYVMALSEYAGATGEVKYLREAQKTLQIIWDLVQNPAKLGRPQLEGQAPLQTLAIPMILLNLIEVVGDGSQAGFEHIVKECLERLQKHYNVDRKLVFENVLKDGCLYLETPAGRLLNPGHAIEAAWFLQHWAEILERQDLKTLALEMARHSHTKGWDREFGGLYYFLDSEGHEPTQLEHSMKLWWPHSEALYAHLLNHFITQSEEDEKMFDQVHAYIWKHFHDPEAPEWFGYLNREGTPTHHFKGGPFKGCFHVPRALYYCLRLLKKMEG